MTYYNDSVYDNTRYFWDYMVAGSTVSGDLFFLLFLLLAPFFLILLIIKGIGKENNLAILGASFGTAFISILMYSLGAVGQHVPIICGVMLAASIIMYKLTEN